MYKCRILLCPCLVNDNGMRITIAVELDLTIKFSLDTTPLIEMAYIYCYVIG